MAGKAEDRRCAVAQRDLPRQNCSFERRRRVLPAKKRTVEAYDHVTRSGVPDLVEGKVAHENKLFARESKLVAAAREEDSCEVYDASGGKCWRR